MKIIMAVLIALLFISPAWGVGTIKQATGTLSMSESQASSKDAKYLSDVRFRLQFPSSVSDTFKVQINSGDGSQYDCVIHSQDMNGIQDNYWQPTRPVFLDNGDSVDFIYDNADGSAYGLEAIFNKQ